MDFGSIRLSSGESQTASLGKISVTSGQQTFRGLMGSLSISMLLTGQYDIKRNQAL